MAEPTRRFDLSKAGYWPVALALICGAGGGGGGVFFAGRPTVEALQKVELKLGLMQAELKTLGDKIDDGRGDIGSLRASLSKHLDTPAHREAALKLTELEARIEKLESK